MSKTTGDRTLALAGLFQAARLVQQTARGEPRDAEASAASIGSIFNTDPADALDVYGDIDSVRIGLEVLVRQLGNDNSQRDLELTRYVVTLVHLERKLNQQPQLLQKIAGGITACKQDMGTDSDNQEAIIPRLAELYSQTLSTLQPRIIVNGEPGILEHADSQNMVRALLLAGIRSAVLLRQSGGGRFRLILQRKKMLETAREQLRKTFKAV